MLSYKSSVCTELLNTHMVCSIKKLSNVNHVYIYRLHRTLAAEIFIVRYTVCNKYCIEIKKNNNNANIQ